MAGMFAFPKGYGGWMGGGPLLGWMPSTMYLLLMSWGTYAVRARGGGADGEDALCSLPMSTEHTGGYCNAQGKMQLTRSDAQRMAAQLHATIYECTKCGYWHLTHRNTSGKGGEMRGMKHKRHKRPRPY